MWYEPNQFTHQTEEGITRSTVPDFRIQNNRTGKTTYIEITLFDPEQIVCLKSSIA